MLDQNMGQPGARLLYFDEQPVSCMRAIDAADDIRLSIRTASHPEDLHAGCLSFRPSAVLAVLRPGEIQARRVIEIISVTRPRVPVLIAGDVDISIDRVIGMRVKSLGLDVRGSVRLVGKLRDLQLALLCAISGLDGDPFAPAHR